MITHLHGYWRAFLASACCSAICFVALASCSGAVSRSQQSTGVPESADLAVAAASVSDESPSAGGKSTLSVTVRNVGTRAAAATTLRYYRSNDPTITTSDTKVGTDAVAELSPSRSTSESLEVTAPLTPGTYYYGACVDAVPDEKDTTNNCSAAVPIEVQDTDGSGDGLIGPPSDMEVAKPAPRIEISPDSLSFNTVDEFQTLTATVYDQNDNVIQPTNWGWSSANEEVARAIGHLFGLQPQISVQSIGEGTTTVTLIANDSITGTVSVTVTLPKARVKLTPASLTFDALGDTKTVTVTVVDENGDKDEDAAFSAFSLFAGTPGIAINEVDDGLEITAEGTGSGEITVSSPGKESAILIVTVYQKPATLTVSPDSVNLQVDGTATLRASVMDANGHDIRLAEGGKGGLVVYWETSDSKVATVDGADDDADNNTGATATVTAVAAGMATITGSWGSSLTDTATITVTESN